MKLRPVLLPPSPDPDKVDFLSHVVDEIITRLRAGQTAENCEELIQQFKSVALRYNEFWEPGGLWDIDPGDLVMHALTPDPPRLSDITEREYLELIRRLLKREDEGYRGHYWYELLRINLGYPYLSLVGTPEQILKEARSYKPRFGSGVG